MGGTKAFGFIKPDGGGEDVFFHVRDIEDGRSLAPGTKVSFVMGQSARGPRALRVTGGATAPRGERRGLSGVPRGAWQMPTPPPASDQVEHDAALARELAANVSQDLSHHRDPSYRDAPPRGWPYDGPRYGGRGDGRGAPPPDYYRGSRAPPRGGDEYYGQY